ncbi:uncharacterized protein l(2)k09913 isoform X3 [Dermacentor andersoni]|uniref:uncharacterized protein l(2)k09913 isoform X3 n=1 Tax=Dermacentor andersoni TaxID=34620 RepID=UPI003B3A26F4
MMALRGLRMVARIVGAPGKQTGLGSACKVLVPCLSLQSMSTAVRTETLNQNMQLRLSDKPPPTAGAPLVGGGGGSQGVVCPVLTSSSSARPDEVMGHRGVSSSSSSSALRENPLTVLLAWMNAKDKHLQHYHDFYLQLGFDVLTVRTLPLQLAFPTSGAQVVAKRLLDFLVNHPNYSRLVVHGFSVGGYQFGEVLVKIRKAGGDYNGVLPRFKAQLIVLVAGLAARGNSDVTPTRLRSYIALALQHSYWTPTWFPWRLLYLMRAAGQHSWLRKVAERRPGLHFSSSAS